MNVFLRIPSFAGKKENAYQNVAPGRFSAGKKENTYHKVATELVPRQNPAPD